MLDLRSLSLSDLVSYFPFVVPAIQSAVVKLGARVSPAFAQLKTWAKITLLFAAGLLVYLALGLGLVRAFVLAVIGTGVAALIYYFGRTPNAAPSLIREQGAIAGARKPNPSTKDRLPG